MMGFEWKVSAIGLICATLVLSLHVNGGSRQDSGPYVVNRWYLMQEGLSDSPFKDCGGSGILKSVEVVPCGSEDRCILKTGNNATINIVFTPNMKSDALSAAVHGIVAGIPMPFHFPQTNACEGSNVTCPITPGQDYFYSVQLPILASYPKIKVTVKWELKDASGKDIICTEIPAKLA